jgi:hypothetical protein
MQTLKVKIEGTSPLLMHAYKGNDNPDLKSLSPKEQAEFGTYRSVTGELILPSENVHRAMIAGSVYVKRGLGKIVSGAVLIQEFEIPIGTKDFSVDSRGVVVMKSRIVRHRARIEKWGGSFTVEFDPSLISEKQLKGLIEATGRMVGVGDFRPEKKGPFGRFAAKF